MRFFCTVEGDDEATRRCLDSIVATLRSVAGWRVGQQEAAGGHNQHLVAAVAELNQAQASFRGMGGAAAECSAASCAGRAHRNPHRLQP